VLYDGEEVPQEAVRHILACIACKERIEAYSRITTEMRLLAAERQSERTPVLDSSALPRRRWWVPGLIKPVRVPRLALAALTAALVILTVGWVRTAAQNKMVPLFKYQVIAPGLIGGGSMRAGQSDVQTTFNGDDGYGQKIEVVSVASDAVVLRLRLKHFNHHLDQEAVQKELDRVAPEEITYVPGQEVEVPVDGSAPAVLRGSVVYQESSAQTGPMSAASWLPAQDEIALETPALVRDGKELIANPSAGVKFRCATADCGVFIYAPGKGLFFFSTQPLEGGIEGVALMSQLSFQEAGHLYTLLSAAPITGGEQPRKVWVTHIPEYRPSQHGDAGASGDDTVALGAGELSAKLRPRR
jgi:hypothetical protein